MSDAPKGGPTPKHYSFTYKGILIDPYVILGVYKITNPAQQHAIKKLLRAGQSHKSFEQDINEVIASLQRLLQIHKDEQPVLPGDAIADPAKPEPLVFEVPTSLELKQKFSALELGLLCDEISLSSGEAATSWGSPAFAVRFLLECFYHKAKGDDSGLLKFFDRDNRPASNRAARLKALALLSPYLESDSVRAVAIAHESWKYEWTNYTLKPKEIVQ